jgi:hypothetical protein
MYATLKIISRKFLGASLNHFQITKKFEKKEFNHAIISIVIRV